MPPEGCRRLRALPLARPAGTTTGGETRVRKLCYRSVNASEKVQLPPASDVRHGDSAWPELARRRPFPRQFQPTLLNVLRIVNERYLLARADTPISFIHQLGFGGYSKIALHDTPQKKNRNTTIRSTMQFHHLATSIK